MLSITLLCPFLYKDTLVQKAQAQKMFLLHIEKLGFLPLDR